MGGAGISFGDRGNQILPSRAERVWSFDVLASAIFLSG